MICKKVTLSATISLDTMIELKKQQPEDGTSFSQFTEDVLTLGLALSDVKLTGDFDEDLKRLNMRMASITKSIVNLYKKHNK